MIRKRMIIFIFLCFIGMFFLVVLAFPINRDFAMPLPNGYELLRLNAYDIRIIDIGSQETIVNAISAITLAENDIVLGSYQEVRGGDGNISFFYLDTKNKEFIAFDDNSKLNVYVEEKATQIQSYNLVPPLKLYSIYAKEPLGNIKQCFVANYRLIVYNATNAYLSECRSSVFDINPVKIAMGADVIWGISKRIDNRYRGSDIVEGYFVITTSEHATPNSIQIGLSYDDYLAKLEELGVSRIDLIDVEEFADRRIQENKNERLFE